MILKKLFGNVKLSDKLFRKVNINEPDSLAYFQKRLRDDGVIEKLLKLGMQDGDTVILGEIEFEYTE